MNKFIVKISLFIGFIGFVFFLLTKLPPYYWGAAGFSHKIRYLEENKIQPDIFFVGPSTVYRHIMPSLFDEILGNGFTSFSLSADGSYPRHDLHIFDNFIDDNRGNVKFVFFELKSFDKLGPTRYKTTYSKYFTDYSWLRSGEKYVKDNPLLDEESKKNLIERYRTSVLENYFKVGMRTDFLNSLNWNQPAVNEKFLGVEKDGFITTPGEISRNKTIKSKLPNILNNLKRNKTRAYTQRNTEGYNYFYSQYLIDIINKYASMDIHVIYILPPYAYKLETEDQMLNLFETIPETNKIDMANPIDYPEFYELKYRFDQSHLNGKGAEIYTRKLINKFKRIQDKLVLHN